MRRPDSAAGSLCAAPSVLVDYNLPALRAESERNSRLPIQNDYTRSHSIIRTRTQDGASCNSSSEYLESHLFVDGFGRNAVTFNEADPSALGRDAAPWIASDLVEYDNKGAVRRKYLDFFWSGTDPPSYDLATVPNAPYGRQRYDAFGRQVQTFDLDGTVTLQSVYHELSTDLSDAADLQPGPHQGTHASERRDGHGRVVETVERFHDGALLERRITQTAYLPTNEPERIARIRGSNPSDQVVRWFRYDSLGRMVLNVEPNTSTGFRDIIPEDQTVPTDLKAWRYAYDDFGDLVGASDARRCGVSYFFDGAGRLQREDYFPCEAHHTGYSRPNLTTQGWTGVEVLYEYDRVPTDFDTAGAPTKTRPSATLSKGRLVRVRDRGSDMLYEYDARGRQASVAKRIARPPPVLNALSQRYSSRWYERRTQYDAADRPVREQTGVPENDGATPANQLVPELLQPGGDGTSAVLYEYSRRGTLNRVESSYGALVEGITRTADALTTELIYGDAAHTTTSSLYDNRRQLASVTTYRGAPASWPPDFATSGPSTFQLLLQDEQFSYDVVNNPVEIHDYRIADEWPDGAKPVTRKMQYDDLYRVTRVDYEYTTGDDTWVSPYAKENEEAQRGGRAQTLGEARRGRPSPHVAFDQRVFWQSFRYDWVGNTARTDDDAKGFYDRSLGDIQNGAPDAGPYQLRTAAQAATSERTGALRTRYDATGNLTRLLVERAGPCLPVDADCMQWFEYDWDEVGRLVRARRWDGETAATDADPVPGRMADAELIYAYDAEDQRVLKTAIDASTQGQAHTVYIFETLELRRARWLGGQRRYDTTKETLVPYLVANGVRLARLAFEGPAQGSGGDLRVFFEMGDHLGSTSVVLDKATGELVERGTYQAYGAAESDYRPDKWEGFREDYRFTGKEEDVEVGLQYFGKRFYAPMLGRWVSADPLGVHVPGQGDSNLFAYVDGQAVKSIDTVGLCGPWCIAGIGAVGSGLFDAAVQMYEIAKDPGKTYADFSFSRVLVSAGAGALGGGLAASATKHLVTAGVWKHLASVISGVATSILSGQAGALVKRQGFEAIQKVTGTRGSRYFVPSGSGPSLKGAAIDAIAGGVGAGVGAAAEKILLKPFSHHAMRLSEAEDAIMRSHQLVTQVKGVTESRAVRSQVDFASAMAGTFGSGSVSALAEASSSQRTSTQGSSKAFAPGPASTSAGATHQGASGSAPQDPRQDQGVQPTLNIELFSF